jgi:hypothetical protein
LPPRLNQLIQSPKILSSISSILERALYINDFLLDKEICQLLFRTICELIKLISSTQTQRDVGIRLITTLQNHILQKTQHSSKIIEFLVHSHFHPAHINSALISDYERALLDEIHFLEENVLSISSCVRISIQ